MNLTERHYEKLLGLSEEWLVARVDLNMDKLRVDIYIDYVADTTKCPDCGKESPIYDHLKERTWRHLDTMQFQTVLHCCTPRSNCSEHGVKNIELPWAGKYSRFTLMFERFAIDVIKACRSLKDAERLLGLSWHQVQSIMDKAVQRGLKNRKADEIPWVGLDEKSFRKGHNYISLCYDLENHRVLDVKEGRDSVVAEDLITESLNEWQREMVCAVAIDMSAPYAKAIRKLLVNADIVYDKFHIAKHINDAVNKTRIAEHKKLMKEKDSSLKGTKFTMLKGLESLSEAEVDKIEELKKAENKTAQAWYIKELFRHFWHRKDKDYAQSFFNYWYQEAIKMRIPFVTKVAKMLKKHLSNILNYFDCYITNAVSEGFNSKIQSLKSNARGFRSFVNYRTRILFFCGKLSLYP